MKNTDATETEAPKLSAFRAVGLAEGFEDGTEDEVIEAWQYLVNTGLAWQLQGAFGRQAQAMIDAGIISAPQRKSAPDDCALERQYIRGISDKANGQPYGHTDERGAYSGTEAGEAYQRGWDAGNAPAGTRARWSGGFPELLKRKARKAMGTDGINCRKG